MSLRLHRLQGLPQLSRRLLDPAFRVYILQSREWSLPSAFQHHKPLCNWTNNELADGLGCIHRRYLFFASTIHQSPTLGWGHVLVRTKERADMFILRVCSSCSIAAGFGFLHCGCLSSKCTLLLLRLTKNKATVWLDGTAELITRLWVN
jgi:hypothetical protein